MDIYEKVTSITVDLQKLISYMKNHSNIPSDQIFSKLFKVCLPAKFSKWGVFMGKSRMIKFPFYLKSQLSELNNCNPKNNSKIIFGFNDFMSPDDECKII